MSDARYNILQLAREMAKEWPLPQLALHRGRLRADGLPRVREALDDDDVRRELDHRC